MTTQPKTAGTLRFLHVADVQWARPIPLDEDMPPPVKQAVLEAKRSALQSAIEAAVDRRVDFILLVGDLIGKAKVPSFALLSLLSQALQFTAHSLPIVVEPQGKVAKIPSRLSSDVVILRQPMQLSSRGKEALVQLIPLAQLKPKADASPGRQCGRATDSDGTIPIIVAGSYPGKEKLEVLMQNRTAHYWALGRIARGTLTHAGQVAHAPGPLQANHPSELGPHGCTLVEVVPNGPPRLEFLDVDKVRFVRIRLELSGKLALDNLLDLAEEKIARVRRAWPGAVVLVSWVLFINKGGSTPAHFPPPDPEELRRVLNSRHSNQTPPIWSRKVHIATGWPPPPAEPETFTAAILEELASPATWDRAAQDLEHLLVGITGESRSAQQLTDRLRRDPNLARLAREAAWTAWELLKSGGDRP